MLTIERFLDDIRKAFLCAAAEDQAFAGALAARARLLPVIAEGEARRRASEARLGAPVPRFCIFSVTWRCNLKCAGCYARQYAGRGDMPLDEIRRVAREACGLGAFMFVIVGGEPLLVPGLVEALAAEREGVFLLFTNGTLLDPGKAALIARAPNVLPVVSIEGDAAFTDARRGPGVGHKAAAAMRELKRARVPFGFSTMVSHRNHRLVTSRAWFDATWDAGARFGFLIDYVPVPGAEDPGLVLTDEDRLEKTTAIEARWTEMRPLVMNFPPDEYAGGGCLSAGRGFLHVNADGWVEPCPFSHYAADNVKEKSLEDILRSPFMRALRERFACRPNAAGECVLCAEEGAVREIAERTGARKTDLVAV
jgi:MoaA/NifB/PqqE/SkfB family radical SAM enzyme